MRSILFSILATGAFVSTAIAGDDLIHLDAKKAFEEPAPAPDFESNIWLDGWVLQLNVGIEESALGLSKSLFIGFDDIISNIDWLVPLGADFRYKRFGIMPDLVAMKISGGGTTPGPFFDRASYSMKMASLNLPVYFRLIDEPTTKLDVLGGARLLWVDLNIGLDGGPLGSALGPVRAGTDLEVWDGIVGLRLEQDLTEKIFCSFYGDVGTGDSDLTWQILAGVGYRFSDAFSANLGYRYLDYDLSGQDASIDMTASGIQLTLDWQF